MSESLGPGAIFEIGGEKFEYEGVSPNQEGEEAIVGRLNPEREENTVGSVHRTFSRSKMQEAVRVGPFEKVFPYTKYLKEVENWRKALMTEVKVPYPPKALVDIQKRAEALGFRNFEPHYIPSMEFQDYDMVVDGKKIEYPETWQLPDYAQMTVSDFKKFGIDDPKIKSCWLLLDMTKKPEDMRESVEVPYIDDPFKEILESLSDAGKIHNNGRSTRLGIMYEELDVFSEALREKLEVPPEVLIKAPSILISNILGNLINPNFGSEFSEWFSDPPTVQSGVPAARYGSVYDGGVIWNRKAPVNSSTSTIGFRPMIIFPQEAASVQQQEKPKGFHIPWRR